MSDVTVIIPTRDEELHIERAVTSAVPLGPVWVVDSESTDSTVELAKRAGANVVTQPWLGHARQKNWALDNIPIVTDWVMFMDADETFPSELLEEIQEVTSSASSADAYLVARRNIFMGRELEYVWWYPDYQMRLFRKGMARYEDREVHEHMVTPGSTGRLKVALVHENLKGTTAFLERHIRYARAEAEAVIAGGDGDRGAWIGRGRTGRRRALKVRVWYRLPLRPLARFVWLAIVRRGYKDGRQGLIYAQLISAYECMIDAYLLELADGGPRK